MTISLSVLSRPVLGLAEKVADHGDGGPGDLAGLGWVKPWPSWAVGE